MRGLPFFKPKKGAQFAGLGFSDGSGKSYTLPPASAGTLGGVKIGSGVNVSEDGTISVSKPSLFSVENFSCTTNEVVTVPVPVSINLQTSNGYCLTVKTSNSFYSDAIFDINAIVNIEGSDVFYLKPNDSVSGTLNILIW